jgi:hypothetical protein
VVGTDHTKADTPSMQIQAGVGDPTQSKARTGGRRAKNTSRDEAGPRKTHKPGPNTTGTKSARGGCGGTTHSSGVSTAARDDASSPNANKISDGSNPACSHARWDTHSVRKHNGHGEQHFPAKTTYWTTWVGTEYSSGPSPYAHPPSDGEEEVTKGVADVGGVVDHQTRDTDYTRPTGAPTSAEVLEAAGAAGVSDTDPARYMCIVDSDAGTSTGPAPPMKGG